MNYSRSRRRIAYVVFASLLIASLGIRIYGEDVWGNEGSEPPLELNVQLNDQKFVAPLNKVQDVSLDGGSFSLLIKQKETRTLRLRHLSFEYPSYFSFESKREKKSGIAIRWDLNGHEINLSILRQVDDPVYDDLKSCVTKMFGSISDVVKLSSGEKVALRFGDEKLDGLRFMLGHGSPVELPAEFYLVPGRFDDCRYLVTMTGRNGDNPDEEKLVVDLLERTFKITAKPDRDAN